MKTADLSTVLPSHHPAPNSLVATASLAQRRLWLTDKLTPGSPLFNNAHGIRFRGVLDPDRLQRAIIAVAERHQPLRMYFVDSNPASDSGPSARIFPQPRTNLSVVDLTQLAANQRQDEANRLAIQFAREPFDLAAGPLFRTCLLRLGAEEHLLVFIIHHIISDRWSVGILMRELAWFYSDSPGPSPLQPITFGYTDFSDWQIEQQTHPAASGDLQYWRELLSGAPPFLDLPADHARPATFTFEGAVHVASIEPDLTGRIKRIGLAQGATPFMTFLTAFLVLLHRITQQADLVIGTPVAGRNRLEAERLIGFFVNVLPVRAQLNRAQSFSDNLRSVRSTALDLLAHQETPFDRIVEAVCEDRDQSRHPLFDVVFNFHNVPPASPWNGDLRAELEEIRVGVARHDLTLTLRPSPGGGMCCEFEYSRELFEAATIARLADQFLRLLESIAGDPACPIAKLPMIDAAERQLILEQWSGRTATAAAKYCVHELFERQAAVTPNQDAVVCGLERLTYAQLNRRVNQLAWRLRAAGVGPEKLVAICLRRTLELPIAVLAVLKAGGAYVPLDPAYPALRLTHMMEVAQPSVLLTQRELSKAFGAEPGRALICMDEAPLGDAQRDDNPPNVVGLSNLAYVIFTSGSTGRPKGVAIEHRGPAALVEWAKRMFDEKETGGMLFSTSVCFDGSVFEFLPPLTRGAKIIIVPNILELPEAPAAEEVTFIHTVPSAMTELIRMGGVPASSRAIGLGGESMPAALARQCYALPQIRTVYNIYGPTEDTVCSTSCIVPTTGRTAPSIGRPIPGSHTYILDSDLQPVSVGAIGELYLGGSKLARCYLHRADLTAERFLPSPFHPGDRLYRSGDLCRWNRDGSIHYLGRIDQQVKLRGFRIELGEIETVLGTHRSVSQCRVIVRGDSSDRQLVAYIVPNAGALEPVEHLRNHLGKHLPGYMIPSAFVFLESMPTTLNGKIDTAAFPAPNRSARVPRTEMERALASIWQHVLGVGDISIDESFFNLGGDSFRAVRLMHEVKQRIGRAVPLSKLFSAPTVERFAAMLSDQTDPAAASAPSETLVFPLRAAGKRRPLFCVPGAGGNPVKFNPLVPLLDREQPVYGFQWPGWETQSQAISTLEAVAALFVSQIRQVQASGPYRLAGYSVGSSVAFEMAQQLVAQQQKVELLVLFDGFAPAAFQPRPRWQKLLIHAGQIVNNRPRAAAEYAIDRMKSFARTILALPDGVAPPPPVVDDPELAESIERVMLAANDAWRRYRPRHYPGTVVLLQATQPADWLKFVVGGPANGWAELADRVEIHPVPGKHLTMFQKPNLLRLADELNRCLERLGD